MDFTVRQADLADASDCAGVVDVLNSYASDQVGGGQPLTREVRERLPLGLREHPTTMVFLAFVERRPVGVAVCFVGYSTFQARPLLNIHDLAVVPELRGHGIGRALLEAVEAEAVQRGCWKITLEVQDANHHERGLYEHCGFDDFVVGNSPTRFLCKLLGSRA